MPELDFKVTGVEPAARGIVPLLHFHLEITNAPATELIQAVILQAQIQIQSAHRSYDDDEREKLVDLFGTLDRWGQTLRNRLWAHANATVRPFAEKTETVLPVQCTYDLNLTATKYFYALKEGAVPLLFLFSGTAFYASTDGRLQVQQIPWEKECSYPMGVQVWQELMERHYPNSAWVSLRRDVFEKLYAYKRNQGLPTWEQTIEMLLNKYESVDGR
ncbi:MAG: hypothetical protein JO279_12650 [Verrucomicrobia bacterium]|nr:hypothetical protein [Verrucomicrobiota bacterium]MBV8377840.1 hypothetical protein [Verrucomicrobiota bacterium]